MARWIRWPANVNGVTDGRVPMLFGADYNPEQWPRAVWHEDMTLMRAAGVNLVNLGIFSWATVAPDKDSWDFGWMDEVLDLLYANGIAVDLGTGTSSPPPWLSALHPEILPVTVDGHVLSPGGRQHFRPSSPVFRRYALEHVATMARRYGDHPALAMWHVSNELGCHNVDDFSDDAAVAFRRWLEGRYGDLDTLNDAWGTAFWSQRYSSWDQILPPRTAAAARNPTQRLDFRRYSSWVLQDYLRAESAILREVTPDIPVTTNFMVMDGAGTLDYAAWARDVDVVANDHYLISARPDAYEELCFSASLTSGLAGGEPWFLMEHSTSAVNWQPVNLPKLPGQLRRDSLTHMAYGSDAVSFFQWRASLAGAEKFHSAMLPHAGTDSRLWRDICALGADVQALAEVVGTRAVPARVAILFDWTSWWASELETHPSSLLRYRATATDLWNAFHQLGITVDVLPIDADFSSYAMVVAPLLYVLDDAVRDRLASFVDGGGHLVTTYFSGVVDEYNHVHLGGYPGALRDLLGVRVEEFGPLLQGTAVPLAGGGQATLWAEQVDITGADVVVLETYGSGDLAGLPAVTRRTVGAGSAAYLSGHFDPGSLRRLVDLLTVLAGVEAQVDPALAGAVTRRERADGLRRFVFLVNHTRSPQVVATEDGVDLLTGGVVSGTLELAPLRVAVIRADQA